MNYTSIGIFIQTLRKEKSLTQMELASMLNVTDRAVSKWERGLGCPDVSLLISLSNIFDVSILEILKGERLTNNLSNDDFIFSLSFFKHKFISSINTILILLFSISFLFIFYTNIISYYNVNKSYDSFFKDRLSNDYDSLVSKIETVRNTKLNYTDEEKTRIFELVDGIEKYLNENEKIITSNTFKYSDMNNLEGGIMLIESTKLYSILISKNPDKVDSLTRFTMYYSYYIFTSNEISRNMTLPNYYTDINIDIDNLYSNIYFVLIVNNFILDDILKVGELSE